MIFHLSHYQDPSLHYSLLSAHGHKNCSSEFHHHIKKVLKERSFEVCEFLIPAHIHCHVPAVCRAHPNENLYLL
ncbi:unnamed protein product [Triticum turgidum subsp. durum]|uniref:Uncharacterized protein n=1 Tax=Triticum turgidum subsp. durum TaxID=4567 RepID=A0A9R0VY54_TRITD|nr:unnamed protein product [Triticum turgidum subsp. durum]